MWDCCDKAGGHLYVQLMSFDTFERRNQLVRLYVEHPCPYMTVVLRDVLSVVLHGIIYPRGRGNETDFLVGHVPRVSGRPREIVLFQYMTHNRELFMRFMVSALARARACAVLILIGGCDAEFAS